MTPLLNSALFPESDPSELAAIADELGFAGIDLAVKGAPGSDDGRTLALLAADDQPALMLSVDTREPEQLDAWAQLASEAGCRALRLPLLDDELGDPADELPRWTQLAADTGVQLLLANHAGARGANPEALAQLLAETDPRRVAALLAPDQIPRSRAGDHVAWVARVRLPAVGAVALGGYRWEAEIAAGNLQIWSPTPALIAHSLTPWPAWLQRLKELEFDGLFTFGDASLSASAAERARLVRDDLRFLRRSYPPRG